MTTNYDSLNSAHNGDSAMKDSHDTVVRAIRTTTTGLPFGASRYVGTVDNKGNYLTITYFADIAQEVTKIEYAADIAGSLNNTYFNVYSARDAVQYYVWYNVNAAGTDPTPGGTGIEIALSTNDPAAVVELATVSTINLAGIALTASDKLITTDLKGDTTDSSDNDTGFVITTETQGVTEVRAVLTMTYDGQSNLITYEQDVKNL